MYALKVFLNLNFHVSAFYELSIDIWSIVYGIGALVMHATALVMIEKLHENFPSTLDLVYMNSFNCLCLFLIADLVQVGPVGSYQIYCRRCRMRFGMLLCT